jgi:hypothetical protein
MSLTTDSKSSSVEVGKALQSALAAYFPAQSAVGDGNSADGKSKAAVKSPLMSIGTRITNSLGKNMPNLRIRLVRTGFLTTSANTMLQGAVAVQPDQTSEWSSIIALYNQVRVVKCHVKFFVGVTVGATASPGQCGVVYDPSNNSTLAAAVNAAEYSQHKVFVVGTSTFPLMETKDGFLTFDLTVPPGSLGGVASSVNLASSEWSPTSASAVTYGYVKWFLPAFGATVVPVVSSLFYMDCEFRQRQ